MIKKKFTGIVIAQIPYGKDNLITLCTAEEGLVNIVVRNTTMEAKKFTYAKEIFTFGYFYVQGDFFYVLERCEIVDTFEKIKNSTHKKQEAINLINLGKEVLQFNDQDAPLMLELMTAIKVLNYDQLQPNLVLSKFLADIFKGLAKSLQQSNCNLCGAESLTQGAYFSPNQNGFVCNNCADKNCIIFSKEHLEILHILLNIQYDELKNVKLQNLQSFLSIMLKIFKMKVSQRFKLYCE